MRIRHVIIKVDDQQKALSFYTSVVGFVKKLDVPIGGVRWLTVSSPEGAEDVELLLEPNNSPPARSSQKALLSRRSPNQGRVTPISPHRGRADTGVKLQARGRSGACRAANGVRRVAGAQIRSRCHDR